MEISLMWYAHRTKTTTTREKTTNDDEGGKGVHKSLKIRFNSSKSLG
jgi:hypothetical protein